MICKMQSVESLYIQKIFGADHARDGTKKEGFWWVSAAVTCKMLPMLRKIRFHYVCTDGKQRYMPV